VPDRETVRITPYRDGPLLVRGPVRLLAPDGSEIEPRRRTVALCRCGKSKLRPFCDGTHKQTGFQAPAGETLELAQASARSPAGTGSVPSA
jgi:CDGSH-type Zn-finger protein